MENNQLYIFKYTPIINKRRVVIYVEAPNEDEGRHYLAKEIKMKPEWIKSGKLNAVDKKRMQSNRFRPNYSVNENAKIKPLSKHLIMSADEIRKEKISKISNDIDKLFNGTWHENFSGTLIEYYWSVRREIIEEKLEDVNLNEDITIVDKLDSIIAGFGSSNCSTENKDVNILIKTEEGVVEKSLNKDIKILNPATHKLPKELIKD